MHGIWSSLQRYYLIGCLSKYFLSYQYLKIENNWKKEFIKYDCLLPASFSFINLDSNLIFTKIDFCMSDIIKGLLWSFSLCLETFFVNGAYLSMIKLIWLQRKILKNWKKKKKIVMLIPF